MKFSFNTFPMKGFHTSFLYNKREDTAKYMTTKEGNLDDTTLRHSPLVVQRSLQEKDEFLYPNITLTQSCCK